MFALGTSNPLYQAFPRLFTTLETYSELTVFQFISVFVLLLSFWNSTCQLQDVQLQERIVSSLPTLTSMIRNTDQDDVIARLLLVWFHINYQTPVGQEIVYYMTQLVYYYVSIYFSFLPSAKVFSASVSSSHHPSFLSSTWSSSG